jgi:hypothetical protein
MDGRIEGASDGPGLEYQANAFPDIRWFPTRKDGVGPGRVPAHLNSPFTVSADTVPSAAAVAGLAAAQAVTAATPMTLVTVAPGGSAQGVPSTARVPLVPFQQGISAQVIVSAIDLGFTTGNVTAGSASVTNIADSSVFQAGQWVCIGGAGNAAKTASLFAQVIGFPSATSITLSTSSLATLVAAPIGNTNYPAGPYSQPNTFPSGVDPYSTAGLARILNPVEGLARCISVTGNAASSAQSMAITGYDIYGVLMHETIAFAGGATTKFGQKAFKYLLSAVPSATDAGHLISIGWGDTFGIHLRSDKWEFMNLFYNGNFVAAQTGSGWLPGDKTNPATATTGDVRGTWQVSANGNGATPTFTGVAVTDGVKRIGIFQTVPLFNNIQATPINPVPLYGQAQF